MKTNRIVKGCLYTLAALLADSAYAQSGTELQRSALRILEPPSEIEGLDRQSIHAGRLVVEGGEAGDRDIEKLVVLIHGWNSDADAAWGEVRSVWNLNAAAYGGWRLAVYDWRQDAGSGLANPNGAAEASYLHGWHLAAEIKRRFPAVKEIQFIAHSAGSWAARSAALGLKDQDGLALQVTLLDPYMPLRMSSPVLLAPGMVMITPPRQVADSLTRAKMSALDPAIYNSGGNQARMVAAEHYYHEADVALGTNDPLPWEPRDTWQVKIEHDAVQTILDELEKERAFSRPPAWYNVFRQFKVAWATYKGIGKAVGQKIVNVGSPGHGLPTAWYAVTMLGPHCYADGWARSLPYRDANEAVSVVAVVDESGSMEGRKKMLAGQGVLLLAKLLYGDTAASELGLVGFSGSSRRVCPPLAKARADELEQGVASLRASGQTAIGAGIAEGMRCVLEGAYPRRVLVLLSDGAHNAGPLWPSVEAAAKARVPVYAVGLETVEEATHTLEEIAAKTGGDYFDADTGNIQQVYAAINARMSGRCVVLYKTDVVRQDEVRDFVFDVSRFPVLLSPVFSLTWPGSRLGLQVLEAGGKDVTERVLTETVRTATTLSGKLEGLGSQVYTLRVLGEEVSGTGEPFNLQVQGHGVAGGIYVKPLKSSYRVGEPVLLSGRFIGSALAESLAFEVTKPDGMLEQPETELCAISGGSEAWNVALPAPDTVGIHVVTARMNGNVVYSASYRCGTVDEVLLRHASAASLLDLERIRLRAQAKPRRETVALYGALSYAATVARTVQAAQPLWEGLNEDFGRREWAAQRLLQMQMPFLGQWGIAAIGFERGGKVEHCSKFAVVGNPTPIPPGGCLARQGTSWWARIPLGDKAERVAVVLEIMEPEEPYIDKAWGCFAFSVPRQSWDALDSMMTLECAGRVPLLFAGVEGTVGQGCVRRALATAFYQEVSRLHVGQFAMLRILDMDRRILFNGAGGWEEHIGMAKPIEFGWVRENVLDGVRQVGEVVARMVVGEEKKRAADAGAFDARHRHPGTQFYLDLSDNGAPAGQAALAYETVKKHGGLYYANAQGTPAAEPWFVSNAKAIYVAIIGANTERKPLGLGSVWPRSGFTPVRHGMDIDISEMTFANSSDYFTVLLDGPRYGNAEWSPFVVGLDWPDFAGGGVPSMTGAGRLTAANNIWTVAADVTDDMPDVIPVLVSRNVDPASLIPTGDDLRTQHVRPSRVFVSPFGGEGFVLIYKGGAVLRCAWKYADLHTLYRGQDARDIRAALQRIRYLTPDGQDGWGVLQGGGQADAQRQGNDERRDVRTSIFMPNVAGYAPRNAGVESEQETVAGHKAAAGDEPFMRPVSVAVDGRETARRTPAQAAQVARDWLAHGAAPLGTVQGKAVRDVSTVVDPVDATTPLLHVAWLEGGGFAAVPADERIQSVTAFSQEGGRTLDPASPLYALLVRDARVRRQKLDVAPGDGSQTAQGMMVPGAAGRRDPGDVRVGPLLKTKWGQRGVGADNVACFDSYTRFDPFDVMRRYPCGCAATAMAQIMKVHRHPSDPVSARVVNCTVDGELRALAVIGGRYAWDDMPNDPEREPSSSGQRREIGKLCYDAGVSVETEYRSNASGASILTCAVSLTNVFGYASAVLADGFTVDELWSIALGDLTSGHPFMLRIAEALEDGGITNGHAVVVDGYCLQGGTRSIHLNMGWSGQSDVWWVLPESEGKRGRKPDVICLARDRHLFVDRDGGKLGGRFDVATHIVYNIRPPAVSDGRGISGKAERRAVPSGIKASEPGTAVNEGTDLREPSPEEIERVQKTKSDLLRGVDAPKNVNHANLFGDPLR